MLRFLPSLSSTTAKRPDSAALSKGAFGNVFTMRDTGQNVSTLKYDFVRKNVLFGNRYSRVKTFFGL